MTEAPEHDLDAERRQQRLARLARIDPSVLRASLSQRRQDVSSVVDVAGAPLSFAQERLLFVEEVEGDGVHHNDGLTILLRGDLDLANLRGALDDIVDRHEVLRTAFLRDDSGWRQEVRLGLHMGFDVSELPLARLDVNDPALGDALQREMAKPLDLAGGVTSRARVFRVSATEHALVITVHHLVCDLWSFDIFARELGVLYNGRVQRNLAELPPLKIQYAAYADAQRRAATDTRLAPHARFWRAQLAGAPATHSLPVSQLRGSRQQFRGEVHRSFLAADLVTDFFRLGREWGVTPYMLLMAAFQCMVSQRSGTDDVVVLSPVATRNNPELEQLIGCFLNFLPVRVKVDRSAGFRELAVTVRQACLEMWEHQDLPFERVVQVANVNRSSSHQPLSQLACVLQNTPTRSLNLTGLEASFHKLDTGRSRMDLTLWLTEQDDGVVGEWEYDMALFDAGQIEMLSRQFERIVRTAVEEPECPLHELSVMDAKEWDFLTHEVNLTDDPGRDGWTIPELFAAQVARTPDAEAVLADGATCTYSELDRNARRLAGLLIREGVGTETSVAVCLPRSLDEVTTILAVAIAGATYVPLATDGPRARRDAIIRMARPTAVVSRGAFADEVWSPEHTLIDLDEHDLTTMPSCPNVEVHPDDIAYVMFTSGSTGSPKGVQVTHRGFCNRMGWGQENYPLGPADRVLHKAASTFDVSLDELFRALFNGAASVQLPHLGAFDPILIGQVISRHQVTDVDFSPTALAELLRGDITRLGSLRRIVSGVEALPRQLEQRVLRELDVTLFNIYGPTEISVSCTSYRCASTDADGPVPIGLPMANTRIYVLDEQMRLLPKGVEGELYVGGSGLARGYLGAPGMTADAFVPDPFGAPGQRLYRTGDRVRWNDVGLLCFVGRVDTQLNVRGYRVEAGEIENALLSHSSVLSAAVTLRAIGSASALVAYYTVTGESGLESAQLRSFVRSLLPDYMVPSYLIRLDELPTNANGKVDRASLPEPKSVSGSGERKEPGTEMESLLYRIWAEALQVEGLGVEDDFFDFGGDSVTASRIIARASQETGLGVRVVALFDNPTIRELGEHLDRLRTDDREPERG